MGEREEFWVECKKGFIGVSCHKYKVGDLYKGYKIKESYYLEIPGIKRLVGISDPGRDTVFRIVDPFLININKVLE